MDILPKPLSPQHEVHAAGISDHLHSSSGEDPLYGEDQGNKWATAAWVIHDGWIANRSIYLPGMSYSLPGPSFNHREIAIIQCSTI
jgi:hypothetical protein